MLSRSVLFVLALAASGCAEPVDATLTHQSVLQQNTRGLALHATGQRGHAGMRHTNCPFETIGGSVTGDYNLPDDDETVEDAGEYSAFGTETVLLTQPDAIHLLNKEDGDYRVETQRLDGVITGRLSELGVVGLVDDGDGCAVVWTESGVSTPVDCGKGFAVDPESGTAFVGGKGRVDVVGPTGADRGESGGDLLAWDRATGALIVARTGDSVVSALEEDGRLRWEVQLDGPVSAVEHAGARGGAVVAWEARDGSGQLTWLDGWTGEAGLVADTPAPAPALEMSANGGLLAVVLPGEAHFFRVD